jgi:hypothetical protein
LELGKAVAGGICTGAFPEALSKQLDSSSPSEVINLLYESIAHVAMPDVGIGQHEAMNKADHDVLRYTTYVAVAASVVVHYLPCGCRAIL